MRVQALILLTWILLADAFAQDLEIYVSDAGNFENPPYQILKFDENGKNPEAFITENLAWPQDIVFLEDLGEALVSNLNTNRIDRYDAETGAFINAFAQGVSQPTRMKIGADGLLYVLQWAGSGRVKRYELDGTFVDDFSSVGVSQSIGMDWDADGNLYVSSFSLASVRKFDPQGNDLGIFVNSNLIGPTNIWFDDNGDLLVIDWSGSSVKRFDANGTFVGNFITGLSQAEGVDFLPNGNILIGNGTTGSVRMYDSNGTFLQNLVAPGSGNLIQPNAVIIRQPAQGFRINAGLNDAWFNPATAGQGFFIIVFPDIPLIFMAWFTYDTERPSEDVNANLGEPGHRWITAQGGFEGDTAMLDAFVTAGGVFDAIEPAPDPAVKIGTIKIVWADCKTALLTYDIPDLGLMDDVPIQRIALDNVALCESLSGQP